MLLPYNVDRQTRSVPWVTYGVIGANVIIFLLSILVANVSLPRDREEGKALIQQIVKDDPSSRSFDLDFGKDDEKDSDNRLLDKHRFGFSTGAHLFTGQFGSARLEDFADRLKQIQALVIVSKHIETPDDYKKLYLVEHAYDKFVDEPHYTILNSFAYHPNEPSPFYKFFEMFTAMFLHSNLDHIFGNMLFLWIFGRAAEEFLGRKFYLSTYLCSGVAATLLQHIVTQNFAPNAMGVPNLGASGAIAGVLGLFAVRFYRTKVRIFYLTGLALYGFGISFAILSAILNIMIGQPMVAALAALIVSGGAVFFLGRGSAWGAFRLPSVAVIAVWVVLFNVVPALIQLFKAEGGGGVAYWAHLGGFVCGAIYAALVGGMDEGKTEYAIEDAHTALETASSDEAILRAGSILQKDQNNPAAHEIAAQGYDRRKGFEMAAKHYEKAIEGYWKLGDRESAARIYNNALETHPNLPLRPALLLSMSSHYAQNSMWNESASILTRLVEEYPDAPEGEIALLRAAQMWMRQYDDPAETLRMVEMFHSLYPESQWQQQVINVEKAARAVLPSE